MITYAKYGDLIGRAERDYFLLAGMNEIQDTMRLPSLAVDIHEHVVLEIYAS